MRFVKVSVLTILAVGALLYGGGAAYLYGQQDDLIFPREEGIEYADQSLLQRPDVQPQALQVAEGAVLRGVLLPAENPSATLIIAFPGNQHDALGFARFLADEVVQRQSTVLAFNYRDYGPRWHHSTGQPGQEQLLADSLNIYDTYIKKLQPSQVQLVGYSMGSSVATYLASQRPAARLVLLTPFTGIDELAKAEYPYMPVQKLLKHKFPTRTWLGQTQVPTDLIHAGQDQLIHPAQRDPLAAYPAVASSVTVPTARHGDILDQPMTALILRNRLLER